MSSSPPPRLSGEAQNALSAYRRATPGEQRRAANLEQVRRRVTDEAAPRAAAAGVMWPLGWGLASAAAAAGLVWGLVEVRSPEAVSDPPGTQAPATAVPWEPARAPTPRALPSEIAPERPAEPPAVQRPAKRTTPVRAAASAEDPDAAVTPTASELREETRRLREVRASIAAGAWDDAARKLAAYTHEFPNGALREDAQAYRIIVRCEQGNSASALRRAFDKRYPASPHAVRLDAACREGKK